MAMRREFLRAEIGVHQAQPRRVAIPPVAGNVLGIDARHAMVFSSPILMIENELDPAHRRDDGMRIFRREAAEYRAQLAIPLTLDRFDHLASFSRQPQSMHASVGLGVDSGN